MIAPLRRAHRFLIGALALTVPPAVVLALVSREELPPPASVPAPLAPGLEVGALRAERDDLWSPPLAIRTRVFASPDAGGAPVVELAPLVDPLRPDVLVYWSEDTAADRLPDGARWLGRLAGTASRRFALPDAARERGGRLHLYSLGHATWLGSAPIDAR